MPAEGEAGQPTHMNSRKVEPTEIRGDGDGQQPLRGDFGPGEVEPLEPQDLQGAQLRETRVRQIAAGKIDVGHALQVEPIARQEPHQTVRIRNAPKLQPADPLQEGRIVSQRVLGPTDLLDADLPFAPADFVDELLLSDVRLDVAGEPISIQQAPLDVLLRLLVCFVELLELLRGSAMIWVQRDRPRFVRFVDVFLTIRGEQPQELHKFRTILSGARLMLEVHFRRMVICRWICRHAAPCSCFESRLDSSREDFLCTLPIVYRGAPAERPARFAKLLYTLRARQSVVEPRQWRA